MGVFLNAGNYAALPNTNQTPSTAQTFRSTNENTSRTGVASMEEAMQQDGVLYRLEGVEFVVPDGFDSFADYIADWNEKHPTSTKDVQYCLDPKWVEEHLSHDESANVKMGPVVIDTPGPAPLPDWYVKATNCKDLKERCQSAGIGLNVTNREWTTIEMAFHVWEDQKNSWHGPSCGWLSTGSFQTPFIRQFLENAGVSQEAIDIGVAKAQEATEARVYLRYLDNVEYCRNLGYDLTQHISRSHGFGGYATLDDPNSFEMELKRRIMSLDVSNTPQARKEFADLVAWFGEGVKAWAKECGRSTTVGISSANKHMNTFIAMKKHFLG